MTKYLSMNTAQKVRIVHQKRGSRSEQRQLLAMTQRNGAAQNQDRFWMKILQKTTLPNYSEIPEPKVILDASKTELDFLNLFIPLDLCALIANETDHYATQVIG